MKQTQPELLLNGQAIQPGEHATVMLPMPKLYDWTPLSMPVHVFRGKKPGPTLCVTAAIHGDEVNGVEVVRRLVKKPIIKKLSGTLIAIPIVNMYGFLYQDRYLMDRRDLNRSFPGSQKGSLAGRLAHVISKDILSHSTHAIDLHSGSLHRSNLPHIRANLDDPITRAMAEAFSAPVMMHAALRDGSMRQYANEKGIPLLLLEAGESLRFDELSIKTGVNGILRVMQHLGMITLKKMPVKKFSTTIARSSYWVRAPISGVIRPLKTLGKTIHKGEVLAKICNPTGSEEFDLVSPISGVIIGQSNLPMVHEGAALYHIACFEEINNVEEHIEYLQESYGEHTDILNDMR